MFKNIFIKAMAAVVLPCMMALMVACGDNGAEKLQNLNDAAAAVDSVFNTVGNPVKVAKATVIDDKSISVEIELAPMFFNVSNAGDALVDYFTAHQLKSADASVINQVVKAIEATEGSVDVAVTSGENTLKVSFSPESIRHLVKAKGSQLNVPRVREQLVSLLEPCQPNPNATQNSKGVSLSVDKGFLCYNIAFDNDKSYKSSGQGLLTGYYLDPLRIQYAGLAGLEESVIEMMKSLGIDGVRMQYSADNTDKVLKQAFPWREILAEPTGNATK